VNTDLELDVAVGAYMGSCGGVRDDELAIGVMVIKFRAKLGGLQILINDKCILLASCDCLERLHT
jgi:hypothetical protein